MTRAQGKRHFDLDENTAKKFIRFMEYVAERCEEIAERLEEVEEKKEKM